MSQCIETIAYPAVFLSGVNFHVSAVIWIFQQAVILKEQPWAVSQTFALVVMVLLDQFLHQLEQTLGVCSIPLDQVLWKTPSPESPPNHTCQARANRLLLKTPLLAILHKSLILVSSPSIREEETIVQKDVLTAQRALCQCRTVLSFPAFICTCFGPSSVNRAGIHQQEMYALNPGRCYVGNIWHKCLSRVQTNLNICNPKKNQHLTTTIN